MTDKTSLPYPEPGGETHTEGHNLADTSRARAIREAGDGTVARRQRSILSLLSLYGPGGVTVHDAVRLLGLHHGQASGSLSALHKAGTIARLSERRDRCYVYVLPRNVEGRDLAPFIPYDRAALRAVADVLRLLDSIEDEGGHVVTTALVRSVMEGAARDGS